MSDGVEEEPEEEEPEVGDGEDDMEGENGEAEEPMEQAEEEREPVCHNNLVIVGKCVTPGFNLVYFLFSLISCTTHGSLKYSWPKMLLELASRIFNKS